MAFKGPIDFPGGIASNGSLISDAIGSGMSISGIDETAGNLRNWAALAAYVTTFTSKATAHAVFKKSQRVVPVDTNALFESGFVSGTGDAVGAGDFTRATVIEENIEATVAAYAKSLAVTGSVTVPSGFFGPRTFTKYTVGYRADHAAVVHENPFGQEWRNDSPNREFPDRKKDHFLLDAYHAYQARFSSAMRIGLKQVEDAIGAVAAKQAGALSSGSGKPRLVRR